MLANNPSAPTCFPIFALIKFMSFGSTLIYPHEEFLIPRSPRTRSKFNLLPPHLAASLTRTQTSAGSHTHPANAGTCNPCGLTRLAQDSSAQLICTVLWDILQSNEKQFIQKRTQHFWWSWREVITPSVVSHKPLDFLLFQEWLCKKYVCHGCFPSIWQ